MRFSKILATTVLASTVSFANASTVLEPTDNNVNFFMGSIGYTIGLFDQLDTGFVNNLNITMDTVPFVPGLLAGIVDIYQNSSNGLFVADNGVSTLTLGATNQFIVALSPNGVSGWISNIEGLTLAGAGNSVSLVFGAGLEIAAVDVEMSAIPVPAAGWLFGTGLIGMVAVARRKAQV